MKKILILLDNYMPNASPNGICCKKIVDILKNKYKIFIICFNGKKEKNEENIKVYNINVNNSKEKSILKKFIYHLEWLNPFSKLPPYVRNDVVNDMFNFSKKIIADNNIDMVISVHLPIETIIVGKMIKENYPNVITISYMLDSFSGGFLPNYIPKYISRFQRIKWEQSLLKSYNNIFLMETSSSHHERFTKNSDWYKKAIYVNIPLITKKESLIKNKNKKNIKLLYTGSLDKTVRNPEAFIKILYALKDLDIICEFVGSCNCRDDFYEVGEKYGDRLLFTEQIPYKDIEQKIRDADILINIGNKNINLIPSKIFEYISYGKPIISTYYSDYDSSLNYLRDYPLSILVDGRRKIDEKKLIKEIDNILSIEPNMEQIYEIYKNNMPESFVNKIDNLLIGGDIKND